MFSDDVVTLYEFIAKFKYKSLFKNPENIKFVQDALFGATNEPGGTSYGSRLTKKEFIFAGKTGTSQVKRFTERQRELEIKNEDLPYEDRETLYLLPFAPYEDPRYSISVVVEHGGSGSKSAAPIAKKVIKKVLEKHPLREVQKRTRRNSIMFRRGSIQSHLSLRDKIFSLDLIYFFLHFNSWNNKFFCNVFYRWR